MLGQEGKEKKTQKDLVHNILNLLDSEKLKVNYKYILKFNHGIYWKKTSYLDSYVLYVKKLILKNHSVLTRF